MRFRSFIGSFLVLTAVVLGGCASTPAERALSFHNWVHYPKGHVAQEEVIVNRHDTPETCWKLTKLRSSTNVIFREKVDCDTYRNILQEP